MQHQCSYTSHASRSRRSTSSQGVFAFERTLVREDPLEIGHSQISCLLQYITQAVYVLCGYRAFEEANIKSKCQSCPPWYIGCTISSLSSAILQKCHSSRHRVSSQETLFHTSNAATQINESRWKPLINRDGKSTRLQCQISRTGDKVASRPGLGDMKHSRHVGLSVHGFFDGGSLFAKIEVVVLQNGS